MNQTLKVYGGGKIAIPANYRRALGIAEGDTVVMELEGSELRIRPTAAVVREVQDLVRRYVPEGRSLVDELIAERRAEAIRD